MLKLIQVQVKVRLHEEDEGYVLEERVNFQFQVDQGQFGREDAADIPIEK